jgi:hypothetical protein
VAIPPAWRRASLSLVAAFAVVATFATNAGASGVHTLEPSMLTFVSAPAGSTLTPIINSGETPFGVGGFMFEGIPDGIGVMPGSAAGTVDAFVNHEQSRVPFPATPPNSADIVDSSVSKLTLDATDGGVLAASVALPSSAGYIRFCSSTMAGPAEGLDRYLYFTNEESNDIVSVPAGAPYGPDASLAPNRQAGYAVVLDPATGDFTQVPGMGRKNHENNMVIPGGWDQIAVLAGDDTFFTPPFPDWSQLYLYLAESEDAIMADQGSLWAFRVTRTDDGKVAEADPFNGANDYGEIQSGDVWQGRFIRVPKAIARGEVGPSPQRALETWANDNNVFQFIRVEDTAYDKNDPRVVYIADTGDRRMTYPENLSPPQAATGRLTRGPSSTFGAYPNGRVFRMEFSVDNPRKVTSFSILLNGDTLGPTGLQATAIHQPDNLGTSANSLMVQEDTAQGFSRVWRYDLVNTWTVIAQVNDADWESSGIVDVSTWFGEGAWLLDVQAHDVFVASTPGPPTTFKREGGQLSLLRVPGS